MRQAARLPQGSAGVEARTRRSTSGSRGTPRRSPPSTSSTSRPSSRARVGCIVLRPVLDLTAVCLAVAARHGRLDGDPDEAVRRTRRRRARCRPRSSPRPRSCRGSMRDTVPAVGVRHPDRARRRSQARTGRLRPDRRASRPTPGRSGVTTSSPALATQIGVVRVGDPGRARPDVERPGPGPRSNVSAIEALVHRRVAGVRHPDRAADDDDAGRLRAGERHVPGPSRPASSRASVESPNAAQTERASDARRSRSGEPNAVPRPTSPIASPARTADRRARRRRAGRAPPRPRRARLRSPSASGSRARSSRSRIAAPGSIFVSVRSCRLPTQTEPCARRDRTRAGCRRRSRRRSRSSADRSRRRGSAARPRVRLRSPRSHED